MALEANGKKIIMDEYDFGRSLPFTLTGEDILPTDTLIMQIKRNTHSPLLLKKEFSNSTNESGTFSFALTFTEEESKMLPANDYVYSLIQVRDSDLRDTILNEEVFKVRKVV